MVLNNQNSQLPPLRIYFPPNLVHIWMNFTIFFFVLQELIIVSVYFVE